ncbi:3-deoxy-7-phosphoheptulonate synthase [Kibdelosporangium aridum]|uniref:3-deoxy-7-phosphoheptulonate synthase n=1 Tax=Kibdelosporangium aridum TaxID=2030 RepID=UPI000A955FF0
MVRGTGSPTTSVHTFAPAQAGDPAEGDPLGIRSRPARQQPGWDSDPRLPEVRAELAGKPPLVSGDDVRLLRSRLAAVANGQAQVILAGDCAEDPAECTADDVARKAQLVELLANVLSIATEQPVVRVGRIAGQFSKPRSRPTERVGGREMPTYLGHMVNRPEPDPAVRQPDPRHMLLGYHAAAQVMTHLGWLGSRDDEAEPPMWTSHEALLLDYELPLLRRDEDGRMLLASTHWPWIGERTRQPEGAHVRLLSEVVNPVACKVGPEATVDEALALCEHLDPWREPGRLTLVARMGAAVVADRLPELVSAVRVAGHPVIWLCDPMHGNTLNTPAGLKTRFVEAIVQEVRHFRAAVRDAGGQAGGLHLEATPDDVTECVANRHQIDQVTTKYTSLCDPRLNPSQAVSVVSAWAK